MQTRTLTGYLGQDLEIRTLPAQSRIVTLMVDEEAPPPRLAARYAEIYAQLPRLTEEREISRPGREIGRLSLATHERGATTWHRLVVEDVDRLEWRNLRLFAKKGAKVQVTARERRVEFTGRDGQQRTLVELVVTTFRTLRRKAEAQQAA
ncbi:MAG TPA: hypothetical protein VF017_22840 [Thermoanaerobaculia bacterium]|nr:hypothetical protein [Thermoanaerobaculia bacterium]